MTQPLPLDERDRRIIALLQKDCRISNADLAERVGMSASALWRRVRVLEEAGVIERYAAVVNPTAIGLTFEALVNVHLTRHNPDNITKFISAIEANPQVQECYATTGQADYLLRVLCADISAYNHFLDNFLFRLPAVSSAQTSVVLKSLKKGQPLQVTRMS